MPPYPLYPSAPNAEATSIHSTLLSQGIAPNSSQQRNEVIFAAPPVPKGTGQPGRRTDGAGRPADCKQINKPLTALVPVYKESAIAMGTTTAEHPTFWFYVPYSSPSAYGEFVLQDETDQTIYQINPIKLSLAPGIVRFSPPPTSAPLEFGKRYRWYFSIYCQKDHQIYASVEGDVQRKQVEPAFDTRLSNGTLQDQVVLYASNGIWYDALTISAELYRTNATNSSWANLLRSVGLETVASEPITDCCKPEK